MELLEAINSFYLSKDNAGLSDASLVSVEWRLRKFSDHCPVSDLAGLERGHVNAFVRWAKEAGYANASQTGFKQTVKEFVAYCHVNGWLDANLASHVKIGKYTSENDKSVDPERLRKVLAALPRLIADREQNPADVRDALIVSFSADSGARKGEIHRLQWKRVLHALASPRQSANGRFTYNVTSEGKTGEANLYFYSETAELFGLWLRISEEQFPERDRRWVFIAVATRANSTAGQWCHHQTISNAFRRCCKFAGVPVFLSHAVRHRNVDDMATSGDLAEAQIYAGHKNITTTATHYRHVKRDQVADTMSRIAEKRRPQNNGLVGEFFKKTGE